MRILPSFLALALLLPIPVAPVVSAPEKVTHLAAFTEAYRETAVRMLAAGCPYATWAASGRHFLFFDPAGDGQTAEVFGDLNTAPRIAILVPGVATTLVDFDRGLGGVARRAPGVQGRTLYQQLSKRDRDVAVISWLGYDPPDGLGLAAATEGRARAGAKRLTTFVRDVLRQRPDATVTLIGHSYGSLVVGTAAATPGLAADSVIFVGSPGVGVDSASRLHVPPGEVWSATSRSDIIQYAAVAPAGLGRDLATAFTVPVVGPWLAFGRPEQDLWFGHNPSDAAFGARVFATQADAGHLGYWDRGRPALDTLAAITLGTAR